MRPRLVATLSAAALPACALVADLGKEYASGSDDDAGLGVETRPPSDGADAAPVDVTPPPEDAPAGDEKVTPHDAGPDATDAYVKPDTGGDKSCGALGQHDFCDAFDDVSVFGAKWDEKVGQAGRTSTPSPISSPFCAQFSIGGATPDSHLLIDHDRLPMRRAVLNAQLQSDVRTLIVGTTVELARIVAVDANAKELGGAYFRGTSNGVKVAICDKNGSCSSTDNLTLSNSQGWHPLLFDVTIGQGGVSVTWHAYGNATQVASGLVDYGAPVDRIRTVIGANGINVAAFSYWDNVTIDWY